MISTFIFYVLCVGNRLHGLTSPWISFLAYLKHVMIQLIVFHSSEVIVVESWERGGGGGVTIMTAEPTLKQFIS